MGDQHNAAAAANPMAERRRLRKLERKRLEEEARQRSAEEEERKRELELLRETQKREEAERIERERLERIAAELKRLQDIQDLEDEEELVSYSIQRNISTLGVFCLDSLHTISSPVAVCLFIRPGVENSGAVVRRTLVRRHHHHPSSSTDPSKKTFILPEKLVFVADNNNRIHVYNVQGHHVFTFGETGERSGDFLKIAGMCTSQCNHLLVCDQGNNRIQLFDICALFRLVSSSSSIEIRHNLVRIKNVALLDTLVSVVSDLNSPRGIAVDRTNGNMYISNENCHRIDVYNGYSNSEIVLKPVVIKTIGKRSGGRGSDDGELFRPFGIAVSFYHIVVADSGNHRIAVFTKMGEFVANYGRKGTSLGRYWHPSGVSLSKITKRSSASIGPHIVNEEFTIVVSDTRNFRIQILDENGRFLRVFTNLSDPKFIKPLVSVVKKGQASVLAAKEAICYQKRHWPLVHGLHPSDAAYSNILKTEEGARKLSDLVHSPVSSCMMDDEQLLVCDPSHERVHVYHFAGAAYDWITCPEDMETVGGCDVLDNMMAITDVRQHRVMIIDITEAAPIPVKYIGATSYGYVTDVASGFEKGELRNPTFVKMHSRHPVTLEPYVVVSDSGNHRVQVFDIGSGEVLQCIGAIGESDGTFNSPQGTDVLHNEERLYVCDQRNHRVQVFELHTGLHCKSFGTEVLNLPTGLAVCPALPEPSNPGCDFGTHREAKVVVGDTGNNRVQVFDTQGVHLLSIGGVEIGLQSPTDVRIEPRSGIILVCDTGNQCVRAFTRKGEAFHRFGRELPEQEQVQRPVAIVLQSSSSNCGKISAWVLDSIRMQWCHYTSSYD